MLKNLLINYSMEIKNIIDKLKIDLNLRPQNLKSELYYKITSEYENLRN